MNGFNGLNTPIATLLTKKMLGASDLDNTKSYASELQSIPYIISSQLYSNYIPPNPPTDFVFFSYIDKSGNLTQSPSTFGQILQSRQYPYIQKFVNYLLIATTPSSKSTFSGNNAKKNYLSKKKSIRS